jgi:hypothetical protein
MAEIVKRQPTPVMRESPKTERRPTGFRSPSRIGPIAPLSDGKRRDRGRCDVMRIGQDVRPNPVGDGVRRPRRMMRSGRDGTRILVGHRHTRIRWVMGIDAHDA